MDDKSKEELIREVNLLRQELKSLQACKEKAQEAEDELKKNREYIQFLFNYVPNAVFSVDAHCIVTSWNKKAEEITGYPAQEVVGKTCTVFAEEPCNDRCGLFSNNNGKPIIKSRACKIRRKDGKMITISKNAELLVDKDGQMVGGIEIFEDITAGKETEFALHCLNKNLEMQVQQRMAEVSNMNKVLLAEVSAREKMQKDIQDANERLVRILDETISALAFAVEKRDPYTSGHQRRVEQLVAALAKEMKFNEEQFAAVTTAAIIHDIGKIYIPAEILSKPSSLTVFEYNLITVHPQVGYDIIKNIEFPWPVADIILQHHERLNGSGYPNKLKGEEILFEANVLIVADVVEAMSSHRPYRPALGIDKALDEITCKKGILYHPKVVDACIDLFMRHGFQFIDAH
ncbi:MAG: HD domain-containing protein [Candidatus Omnitrophica bacterium]|nr:HD domain-containing protein [Candidatus Omnitrophota bacterium]MBU4478708.1 HD domain-containing protein [Candidatus Omnitrophota bacterium]